MVLVSFASINETLDCFFSDQDEHADDDQNAIQKDFFENVYSDPILNKCMIAVYLFGFIGCAGLILVLWFERSGLAGPYRTLVNQLASQNIVKVSFRVTKFSRIFEFCRCHLMRGALMFPDSISEEKLKID